MGKIQALSDLRVYHLSKKQTQNNDILPTSKSSVFLINTCLRKIWITFDNCSELDEARKTQPIDKMIGGDAYEFLLRIACGLESEIIGETDIFGQFKSAWSEFKKQNANDVESLQTWIQKLFEDTKEIRTQFVQNIGGSNYGSLVRKMIKERSAQIGRSKPILLVGAGQLAQSILPYLKENEVWVWNRSLENAIALKEIHPGIKILDTKDKEIFGWKNAAHIIVCIPSDETADTNRLNWINSSHEPRSVIHLGALKKDLPQWTNLDGFFALDDIFKLQQDFTNTRLAQIERAKKACVERAILRVLGASTTMPHGWEDLLHFV